MAHSLQQHFGHLPDPRRAQGKRHRLSDLIVIAVCGVICGADSWADVADFGEAKLEWFTTFLDLPHGIACCRHRLLRHLRAGLRPARARGVRAGVPRLDPGLGRVVRGQAGGNRRQADPSQLRPRLGPLDGRPSGQRVCPRESDRVRPVGRRLQRERDRRYPQAAGVAGPDRVDGDDRRDGLPDGYRRAGRCRRRGLRAGREGEPAEAP